MGERHPFLYFNDADRLMICFYRYEPFSHSPLLNYCVKIHGEHEISEVDALTNYHSLYMAALENRKKCQEKPAQEKQEIKLEKIEEPKKEGIEKVATS